jgi:hypothetical protein
MAKGDGGGGRQTVVVGKRIGGARPQVKVSGKLLSGSTKRGK